LSFIRNTRNLTRVVLLGLRSILRRTVALIQANLLAIAVVVAALTMAFSAVLKPGPTACRHIAGPDNTENNTDFR
jgi:hypothetical protein